MAAFRPAWIAPLLLASALSACNCGDEGPLNRVPEEYKVVPGVPTVTPDTPIVREDTEIPPVSYAINVPRQCDIFSQNTVRKVDILWVVDSSGSMAPHQAQLASNFQSFITYLLTADPPIDFHIGVVTTDTDDPREQGTLHGWTQSGRNAAYIACDSNRLCNTNQGTGDTNLSVRDAFSQMSKVGTQGSQVERGLYATYLALTKQANLDRGNGGFVRSDAALYVVFVSDEDDSSCAPLVNIPTGGGDACRADPGCHCADENGVTFGTTDYYVRFLENYKGFGKQDLVAAAAITATDKLPVQAQFGDTNPHQGCTGFDTTTGRNLVAYYGKRYIDVANRTGGVGTSICAGNFNNALTNLGFAVSGLRREFKLTRSPVVSSLEVYVSPRNAVTCTFDADCASQAPNTKCQAGKCSKPVSLSPQPSDQQAQYLKCQSTAYRNIINFGSAAIPPAQGTVQICYGVDSRADATCQ